MQERITPMSRRMRLRGYTSIQPTRMTRAECQLCLDPPIAQEMWQLIAFDTLGDWQGLVCRNCIVYARSLSRKHVLFDEPPHRPPKAESEKDA